MAHRADAVCATIHAAAHRHGCIRGTQRAPSLRAACAARGDAHVPEGRAQRVARRRRRARLVYADGRRARRAAHRARRRAGLGRLLARGEQRARLGHLERDTDRHRHVYSITKYSYKYM